ncbi:MAG TPA: long-chain fatty acid--CoA ligase [Bacteroidales bacterium]|nr:long-chain fatty acid--CoA ligase [Bacteroidales bacterium]
MMQENLTDFISTSIKKNWELNSMTDYKGESLSFKDVGTRIVWLHGLFEAYGVKKGDKIALIGKNSANWGVSFLATITYGAVIVPILPDFKANDMMHIINHSESVMLFAADNIFEGLEMEKINRVKVAVSLSNFSLLNAENSLVDNAPFLQASSSFDSKYPEGLQPSDINFLPVPNADLAEISYTSGTTGFTKGVMIHHNSLVANVVYANNNMPLEPGDKIVSFLPLAHTYGCAFEFLWPFTLGCHITFLTKTPSPQIILEAFKKIRPRLVLSVPLVIEKIYKKQLLPVISKPSIKILLNTPILNRVIKKKIRAKLVDVFGGNFHEVVIGGAALNHDVEVFFNKIGFPFSIGYGMTECGPLISYAQWDKTKLYSAGKLVDSLQIKIDSSDPYNEVGEIMVKGENVMLGYYKNPEATQAALTSDGWLRTGDLGVIDKENFVYIKGRSKSMILGPSGQNIYPEEIEARYNNLPFVQESLVVEKNNQLVALVYPDLDAVNKSEIKENDLMQIMEGYRKQLNHDMPAFMSVSRVKIVPEEFEKTPKKSIKSFLYTLED